MSVGIVFLYIISITKTSVEHFITLQALVLIPRSVIMFKVARKMLSKY